MSLKNGRLGSRPRPASQPRSHTWAAPGLFALAALLLVWSGMSLLGEQPADEASSTRAGGLSSADTLGVKAPSLQQRERAARAVKRAATRHKVTQQRVNRNAKQKRGPTKLKVARPEVTVDPESIQIPALGINQQTTELGVIGNDLQVPDDYSDVGWWRDGPTPGGKAGAAVMVGHVDSPTGPAVFYQLSGLQPGHEITVSLENGARAVFVIRKVEAYKRTTFPSTEVYRTRGKPELHLLTCGGNFDAGAEQYDSNVVAYAALVDRIPPPKEKADKSKTQPNGKERAKGEEAPEQPSEETEAESEVNQRTGPPDRGRGQQ